MTGWAQAGALRRIRRLADLSQRQLAERLGISKSGVAAFEAGTRGIDVDTLVAAAALAGLRLALLDPEGREVSAMSAGTVRDGAGRRFPAHLDTEVGDDAVDVREYRRDRPFPVYTAHRDRARRDALRARRGTPDDHLASRPGDSPEERHAARQDAARRQRRAERERLGTARDLPPLVDPVCGCPSSCDTGLASGRPRHIDGCACACDIG
ncbi:helix-turn-helix domain-containing protein [Blastococcus sp. SYSU D00695]